MTIATFKQAPLTKVYYGFDESGDIYMLQFQFGNNILSPPEGIYEKQASHHITIPREKYVRKIFFRTRKGAKYIWLRHVRFCAADNYKIGDIVKEERPPH